MDKYLLMQIKELVAVALQELYEEIGEQRTRTDPTGRKLIELLQHIQKREIGCD